MAPGKGSRHPPRRREPRRISLSRSCLAKKSARLPGPKQDCSARCSSSPGTERGPYPGRRRNRRASRHSFNASSRRDRGSGRGVGNGQRELGDVILGLEKIEKGTRIFWGRDATQWSVGPNPRPWSRLHSGGPAGHGGLSLAHRAGEYGHGRHAEILPTGRLFHGLGGGFARDLDQSLKRLGFTIPSFFVPLATLSGETFSG